MKGLISINRFGLIGEDIIRIKLRDANSRLEVIEIEMKPDDFARALMNVADQDAEFEVFLKGIEYLGKKRIVQKVNMDLPSGSGIPPKEEIVGLVENDFIKRDFASRGWSIRTTGVGSQQDYREINGHRIWTYTVEKYEEVE